MHLHLQLCCNVLLLLCNCCALLCDCICMCIVLCLPCIYVRWCAQCIVVGCALLGCLLHAALRQRQLQQLTLQQLTRSTLDRRRHLSATPAPRPVRFRIIVERHPAMSVVVLTCAWRPELCVCCACTTFGVCAGCTVTNTRNHGRSFALLHLRQSLGAKISVAN